MKKQFFIIISLFLCLICLTGCSKVSHAKACIDKIYDTYDKVDNLDAKLLLCTDAEERENLERRIRITNRALDGYLDEFSQICSTVTDRQLKRIEEYANDVSLSRLMDIILNA